jgi:hypothetical protein
MADCPHENLKLVGIDETGVPYYKCVDCGGGLVIDLMHEITETVLRCHVLAAGPKVLESAIAAAVAEHDEPE